MKYLILLTLFFISCGGQTPTVIENQESCSVTQNGNNITLTCPNGTQATFDNANVVQFCVGVINYPTVFPEIGICIANVLYADYWDGHNSWLSEIPPGNYESTSTSLPCNFTVLNNCQIQNY